MDSPLFSPDFGFDATILIVSSGLLPSTRKFYSKLFVARNERGLSKRELLQNLCQSIIDEFLGTFSDVKRLNLSCLIHNPVDVITLLGPPFDMTDVFKKMANQTNVPRTIQKEFFI